ncbi:hypothetical protein ACIBIZ_14015 [Nonomuraea spiralis]|uniref:hypothetical protein n=1 Tax=Nonomuraea TaxID=83681 RepID=UPI00163BA4F9|nr:hypothetical protein [Nonomuraea sp. WAC 01424]
MPYAIALVAFACALCVLNLTLTLAVVRRLRDHTGRIDELYAFVDAELADRAG